MFPPSQPPSARPTHTWLKAFLFLGAPLAFLGVLRTPVLVVPVLMVVIWGVVVTQVRRSKNQPSKDPAMWWEGSPGTTAPQPATAVAPTPHPSTQMTPPAPRAAAPKKGLGASTAVIFGGFVLSVFAFGGNPFDDGGHPLFPIAAVVVFLTEWRRWRRGVLMNDTPTTPPSAVTIGRIETTGHAALPPNSAGLGHDNAAWCVYRIEKLVRSGKSSSWQTQLRISSERSFRITDEDGEVTVLPVNVTDEIEEHIDPAVLRFSANQLRGLVAEPPGKTSFDADRRIDELPGSWRVIYQSVRPGEQITAYGNAVVDPTRPGEALITGDATQKGDKGKLYLGHGTPVANERHLSRRVWLVLGAPVAAVLLDPVVGSLFAGVALPFTIGTLLLDVYNRLVGLSNQIDATRSLIDVALTRRAELIGNLENTAKAAMAQEYELQTALSAARAYLNNRNQPESLTRALDTATGQLLGALVERYPDLKTDEIIANMIEEIIRTENRVASARNVHNQAVALMRTRLGSLPYSIFTKKFASRTGEYFLL